MAETLICDPNGERAWYWYNIKKNLEEQGGLDGVIISPVITDGHCGEGVTKEGVRFDFLWFNDAYMIVAMNQEDQNIIEAFAKVVEYRPFCRYIQENGYFAFAWIKNNPDDVYALLQQQGVMREPRKI